MSAVLKFLDKHQEAFLMILSLFGALFVGGIFLQISGHNPFEAYGALLKGALGSKYGISDTITNSVPLILTGLALVFSAKVGIFNIGAEGQLYVGALFATIVGLFVKLPPFVHSIAAVLAAIIGGALWALIASYLKESRKVNVVISTILLNYLAIFLVQFLINEYMGNDSLASSTPKIQDTAKLPYIIPMPYGVSLAIVFALIAVVAVYIILDKTVFGFKIKIVGLNKDAAEYAGMNVTFLALLGLVISGALAGMGGGLELLGRQHFLSSGFSPGYGYSGIPVSLMAKNNPFAVILSALLFSILSTGSTEMQKMGVSTSLINVIQGLVVLFIAGQFVFSHLYRKTKGGLSK